MPTSTAQQGSGEPDESKKHEPDGPAAEERRRREETKRENGGRSEGELDEALEDTFPASDPAIQP